MRDGGQGLLEYDQLFQQQVVLNPSLPWNVIHSGLQLSHHNMLSPYSKGRLLEVTLSGTIYRHGYGRICLSWNDMVLVHIQVHVPIAMYVPIAFSLPTRQRTVDSCQNLGLIWRQFTNSLYTIILISLIPSSFSWY